MDKYFERYLLIDYFIRKKSTGTPTRLAKKLSISRSNLYLYLKFLKKKGAPIIYNRTRSTFCYSSPFNLGDIFNKPIVLEKKKSLSSNKSSVQTY